MDIEYSTISLPEWMSEIGDRNILGLRLVRLGLTSDVTILVSCTGELGRSLSDYTGHVSVLLRPSPDNGESMTVSRWILSVVISYRS